ncbi:Uncharacterised protein [Cedecea neteri]|uniref:Uncharacterized protein n=1 Tax=Cedecea neteri TaxID=158822 RepID=A0A2X2T1B7_9ENTR|nr:Uncharacterised protein [Cedecea neteri]
MFPIVCFPPLPLGDSRWVYRFSGDELAGRRGCSGDGIIPRTRSPYSELMWNTDFLVNGTTAGYK